MRYQLLLHVYLPVALFVLSLIFQKPLKKYALANPKRLWLLAAAFLFGQLIGLIFLIPYSIYFFFAEYKAAQAVADIASSKISSAAQGYTEIIGQGLVSQAARSPVSSLPCLWYSYSHYKTNGFISRLLFGLDRDKWELIDTGKHDALFAISDGSASCFVDPKGAQVSNLDYEEWYEGNSFYKEARLVASKDLYVLGNFKTQTSVQLKTDLSRQVGELIAEWKLNQSQFKKRFDLDADGHINEQELALVRAAAMREIQNSSIKNNDFENNSIDNSTGLTPKTTISKPADGRPFIISHYPHNKLIKRHKLYSYFYLILFVCASLLLANKLLPQQKSDEQHYPKAWPALVLDPYRLTCTDLTGTYATKSNVGTIELYETFIGNRLLAQPGNTAKPYFQGWDSVTLTKSNEKYGAQNYLSGNLNLTLERNPQTMLAFETQLKAQSAIQYQHYLEMINPATRRKNQYFLPETADNYIEPAKMSNTEFDNAIDDQFLWHRHHYVLTSFTADYVCENGWVVSNVKTDDAKHPWVKVAVTKDVAGNLVARKFYKEPNQIAGVIFDDKITVLNWTRWPKLASP